MYKQVSRQGFNLFPTHEIRMGPVIMSATDCKGNTVKHVDVCQCVRLQCALQFSSQFLSTPTPKHETCVVCFVAPGPVPVQIKHRNRLKESCARASIREGRLIIWFCKRLHNDCVLSKHCRVKARYGIRFGKAN